MIRYVKKFRGVIDFENGNFLLCDDKVDIRFNRGS